MAEYNFKTGVDAGEYRDFLNVSPAYCFTQLPEWSEVKDNWDHDICMLYKDGAPSSAIYADKACFSATDASLKPMSIVIAARSNFAGEKR